MVEIPSVNPFMVGSGVAAEQVVGQFYATELAALGFDVEMVYVEPGRPNVIGRRRGSSDGLTLLLAGHLDTVGVDGYANPFDARIVDGRIYGRGSCDMKSGLAAILEASRVTIDRGFAGELVVVGTCDEEDQMLGSVAFDGPEADFGIVAEPTGLAICPAHNGQLIMFIRTFGVAVHSSVPTEGVNAINHMGRVLSALEVYGSGLAQRPDHELCGVATVSPGVIRGGDHATKVPDFCEVEVDRRVLPDESFDAIYAEYREIFDALAAEDPEFRYELSDPTMACRPLATPVDHRLVTTIAEAVSNGAERQQSPGFRAALTLLVSGAPP